jgi:lipoyl(octanoyl) transferase
VELRRQQRIGDVLFLAEHPPVITLGRNARRENILMSNETLAQRGIGLYETNRGGDVTYHGPGQLVGYPILDLRGDFPQKRSPYLGPVDYVRLLEELLIAVCAEFGVASHRIAGCTGVWSITAEKVHQRKLAAIGVHVSVGITSHGFALNLTNDLREFDCIIPCGITDRTVTSLQAEINTHQYTVPNLKQAQQSVARHFGNIFARDVLWAESLDELYAAEAVST